MKNNKKNIIIGILVLIIIGLVVYNFANKDNKKIEDNPSKNEEIVKDNSEDDNKDLEKVITQEEIRELEINIEYNNKEIEIDYEKINDKIKAEYENQVTNEYLKGDEAAKIIEDKLLDINYNNPQSDIVDSVLNALDLDETFTEFDLEIIYINGTKIDFEIEQ